jgi:hypothetical protein
METTTKIVHAAIVQYQRWYLYERDFETWPENQLEILADDTKNEICSWRNARQKRIIKKD